MFFRHLFVFIYLSSPLTTPCVVEFKTSQGRKRVRLESESGSEDEDRSSKKQHAEFTSSDDEESGMRKHLQN